jgi:hypothetical protein
MSCPECECLDCFEANPRSDDEVETEEIESQIRKINALYFAMLNREASADELFDPVALSRMASLASVWMHSHYLGLMAILHRVAELEWDQ